MRRPCPPGHAIVSACRRAASIKVQGLFADPLLADPPAIRARPSSQTRRQIRRRRLVRAGNCLLIDVFQLSSDPPAPKPRPLNGYVFHVFGAVGFETTSLQNVCRYAPILRAL